MDKIKIKTAVTEVKVILDELVAESLLDGDQAKIILFNLTVQTINKELNPTPNP